MVVGVSKNHGAHSWYQNREKLLIGVLLPWVLFNSSTMRIMRWVLKDGESGGMYYTVLVYIQTGSGAVVRACEQRA